MLLLLKCLSALAMLRCSLQCSVFSACWNMCIEESTRVQTFLPQCQGWLERLAKLCVGLRNRHKLHNTRIHCTNLSNMFGRKKQHILKQLNKIASSLFSEHFCKETKKIYFMVGVAGSSIYCLT